MEGRRPLADEVEGVASIAAPLPLAVLAEVLEVSESDIVEAVEGLEGSGRLASTRQGVTGYSSSLSPVRMTHLASRLADALQRRDAPLLQVGRAVLAAGDAAAAHRTFTRALDNDSVPATERFDLIDLAIESGREARVGKPALAPLMVARARQHRTRGDSELAVADLEAATPHLEGDALVDAYGFAAQLHDDAQRPADAERTIAMALLVAARGGMHAKLGSLLTFQGRLLARLGFEAETERVFDLGRKLVDSHGDETQRHYAALNQAWTDLDRGWAARAEERYSVARARAVVDDPLVLADLDIAIARAKFAAGDAMGARALLDAARKVASESDAPALNFLSTLALAEGAITFRQRKEAVDAAAELRTIVDASFPLWRNRAATVEARALLLAQRHADAREAIRRGFETTPPGANGLRLRTELEALALMADERWDEERATDVADRLLQGGWLLAAAGVLTERAKRENRPELGRAAAALAHRIGAAPAAAAAIEAADAWDEPAAGPVALAMRRVAQQVPEEWREQWMKEPAIAHALATEATAESTTDEQLLTHLDAALDQAGLAGREVILSPAQRRAAGFVSSGSTALSIGRFVAWVAAAAVVAAVVAIALRPEPVELPTAAASTTLPATTTTTTTIPPIMERVVPIPDDIGGQVPFAGGDTRNARFDVSLGEPTGVYWTTQLTGFVRSDPVLRGRGLYIGDSEGWFYGLDIALEGTVVFETRMEGAIDVSPSVEQVVFQQDDQGTVLTFGGDDRGNVLVRHVNDTGGVVGTVNLGAPITGPPLVRAESMIVATTDGVIFDLLPSDGTELRRFPAEGVVDGGLAGPLAADGNFIYARTARGAVVVVEEATFSEVCTVDSPSARAATHVVIEGDRWYVGTSARTVRSFGAGGCNDAGIGSFQIDTPVAFAPVFADGVMWAVANTVVLPIDIETGQTVGLVSVREAVTSPPVIAGDIILLTTEADNLIAYSTVDGSELWRFAVGSPIRNRPVVANDLVLIATARGEIIAIATPGS